jgi:hypothetical protein
VTATDEHCHQPFVDRGQAHHKCCVPSGHAGPHECRCGLQWVDA